MQSMFGDEPENYFEKRLGTFGQWEETQMYMLAHNTLMDNYVQAAFVVEIKDVWEKALFHALELLRLDAIGPTDVRYTIPFMLLNLNRDDAAFDFIRHWTKFDFDSIVNLVASVLSHVGSQEGQCLYPREKNCRYLDMFEECPSFDDQEVPLAFLVAILVIKLRLVATYDATHSAINLAFNSPGGRRIQEVKTAVKEMLIDDSLVNYQSQRHQIERLMDVIHRNNPIMLPAILNRVPLLMKNLPQERVPGSPSEALFVVIHSARCFTRVPGAEEILERRFGKKPYFHL
jgi:hypothetical protein